MKQPFLITESRRLLKQPEAQRAIRAFAILNTRDVALTAAQWDGLLGR